MSKDLLRGFRRSCEALVRVNLYKPLQFSDPVHFWTLLIAVAHTTLYPRLTHNEPSVSHLFCYLWPIEPNIALCRWCVAVLGYGHGVFAPGRTSNRTKSEVGDSKTEPWM